MRPDDINLNASMVEADGVFTHTQAHTHKYTHSTAVEPCVCIISFLLHVDPKTHTYAHMYTYTQIN